MGRLGAPGRLRGCPPDEPRGVCRRKEGAERNPPQWSRMHRDPRDAGGVDVIFVLGVVPIVMAAPLDLESVNSVHGRGRVFGHFST